MKKIFSVLILLLMNLSASAGNIDENINEFFAKYVTKPFSYLMYAVKIGDTVSLPLIVVWLFVGAVFFTFYFKFVNIRLFKTAINIVRGKYDDKESQEEGEVSHFQALTAALSGTVGLGNIAGVAAAISLGGPGATFWMILAGLLGMSSKFVECTLGVKYRKVNDQGEVRGGPMYYLEQGLKEAGVKSLGKVLAVIFAVFAVLGSFGGGNMFQSNQAFKQIATLESLQGTWFINNGWFFGVIMAILVAVVIIGGIKSIAKVTDKIVPFMVGIYVFAALIVLFAHFTKIPWAFGLIFTSAFSLKAGIGGVIGIMVVGIQRAAFSNEAGVGSASIAHAAVKTKYPASEGIVSLLEPFIDTVVVCTMTALVLIITGYYNNTDYEGVALTSEAFSSVIPWAKYVIMLAAILFAFSTMISWSYYGAQSWGYLFGHSIPSMVVYKTLFCVFVVIGAASSMGAVLEFSDIMILAMSFPNIIGLYFLMPKVKKELSRYLKHIGVSHG